MSYVNVYNVVLVRHGSALAGNVGATQALDQVPSALFLVSVPTGLYQWLHQLGQDVHQQLESLVD